jgi:hypothetical protein
MFPFVLLLLMGWFMKNTVEIASDAMIYLPIFMNIRTGVQGI